MRQNAYASAAPDLSATPRTSTARVLTALSRRPGATTTVFFHPLGGGLLPYLGLIARMSRKGPVYGVRAVGLAAGERPDAAIPAMADRYADLVAALPEPADLLIGWSLGGVLAYESALRAPAGHTPDLVLIDSNPCPHTDRPDAYRGVRERVLRDAAGQLDAQEAERSRLTVDAHLQAYLAHRRPSGRYPGRVLVVPCTGGDAPDQAEGWRPLVDDLTVRTVDTDHFGVLDSPYLAVLAGHIEEFLAARPC